MFCTFIEISNLKFNFQQWLTTNYSINIDGEYFVMCQHNR